MDPHELQEVRKIIEKSTSKVSLRDLERKGFRKVKVLRSNDIDDLIRRAVHTVISREGVGSPSTAAEKEELVRASREELQRIMRASQEADKERAELAETNEQLEQQVRALSQKARGRDDLDGKIKELQRRLADEEEARRRAEMQAGAVDVAAVARAEAAERRAADLERTISDLRRRSEDSEHLRAEMRKLETERRLADTIEIPKLRERIDELQGELRVAKSRAQESVGVGDEKLRLIFREMMTEMLPAMAARGGDDAVGLREEMKKMSQTIAASLARHAGGVTDADFEDAKISIAKLFEHEAEAAIDSNIQNLTMKEAKAAGVKDHLRKLKSLRKGGSSDEQ